MRLPNQDLDPLTHGTRAALLLFSRAFKPGAKRADRVVHPRVKLRSKSFYCPPYSIGNLFGPMDEIRRCIGT